ncbi:MAG TPA: carboxypeptidase-like regulatory domain-containing protein, partial [Fibrobacteria bacterium]|nr:carboxypeptidase-like regulatory domain-containing protein [Fibrobacteria bacterium]
MPVPFRPLALGAGVLLCLAGCLVGGGSASEDTNTSLSGQVVYPDHRPAAGASVFIRPVDYLKDTADFDRPRRAPDAVTDSQGRYRVDSLDPGEYMVEIQGSMGGAVLPGRIYGGDPGQHGRGRA